MKIRHLWCNKENALLPFILRVFDLEIWEKLTIQWWKDYCQIHYENEYTSYFHG